VVDFSVRFARWNGGNAGRVDPAMIDDNAWVGTNVQMYPTGLIGPRWGLKPIVVQTDDGGDMVPLVIPQDNGPLGFAVIGPNLFIAADAAYAAPLSDLDSGTLTAVKFDDYASEPTDWVTFVPETDDTVFSLTDTGLYKHTISTFDTAAITTPADFSFIRRWNLQCVGVDADVTYRLWFSEVSVGGYDFSVWPVDNYIDVGDDEPITAVVPLYNSLFVGKRSGWWAITGLPGDSTQVRQVTLGDGPVDLRGTAATADNRVAYWPRSSHPAYFTGAATSLLLDQAPLDPYDPNSGQAVCASPTGRTVIFGYDHEDEHSHAIMVAALGGSSHHQFTENHIGSFAPDVIENGYGLPAGYILAAKQTSVVGEDLAMFAWRIDPDRPPLSTDALGAYGDGMTEDDPPVPSPPITNDFSTRAWYDPQGRDVKVRSAIVHLRAWGIGDETTKLDPAFGLRIDRLGPYDDSSAEGTPIYWRLPYGEAPAAGGDYTARLNFGDGFAGGFQITVVNMVGVAIRDIIAFCEFRGQRL
jgi:hypothetical protein